ncbi:hypothetical protein HPB51_006289 [Rhipicephalus microplus]|uniref:Uncharacterized protein n=1 Tax=Rhipicephalus microplus TaxID=6941 RepID=A0A9J6EN64_RHIMP|nr:hypothetical protein HPB51_006289 [Rhipicephalus microplus]
MQPAQPLPHAAVSPPTAAAPPAPAAMLPPPEPQPVAPREPAQNAHLAAPKQYTAQTAGQIPCTCAVATVKSAPSDPLKREYVTAVRAYEEQVGANIVRGKMFVESLPMNRSVPPTGMLPGMVRGMTRPGMECGYNMAMGAGGPCQNGQQMPMGGGFRAFSLSIQRNREDFENMMNYSGGVDFARMEEMGPQVRRLLDMGSQIDQIMDMIRRAEGSPIIMGLDSVGGYRGPAAGFGGSPPMISGGGFGVPMPGGYGGPMMPPYGTPPMMMGSGFGLPMPGGYGGPMMRPYGAPMPDMTSAYSTERFLGGYERPAMNPRMSGSTDWRRDDPRELGRRTMSRESTRPPRDEYTEDSRLLPKQSMSRASDLLQKIKEEIDEHRAETVLEKIRRDVVTMDDEDDVGRGTTARRISISPEMGKTTSRTSMRSCDDWDYRERRSPRPMRRTSRHHKSSLSSSSSASSHGKPLKQRLHKSKDSKGKRRKSQGKKRRGSAPAKNGSSALSSSSSSSSSGRRSPRNKGDKSIKFIRQVTERLSSESSADEDPVAVMNEFHQKYLLIARPESCAAINEPELRRSGCPFLKAVGIGSREKGAMRTQSRAFGGSVLNYRTDRQP